MSISEFLTLEEWLEVDETTGAIQHAGAWTTQAQTVEDIRGGIMEPSEPSVPSFVGAACHSYDQCSHVTHPQFEPLPLVQHWSCPREEMDTATTKRRMSYAAVLQSQAPMHREVSLRVVQAPIIGVQRHNGTMSSLRSSIIPETAVPTTLDQPTTSFATSEVPRPTYAQAVAGSTANAGYSGAQRSAHAYGKNATWQNEKQASKSTSSANAAHREHSAKRARYNSNSASPPRPYPRSTSPASTVDAELAANANYQLGAQPATQTVGAWNLVSKLPGDRLTQNLATTHLLPPPTSTHASPTASSVSSGRSARRTQEEMRSSPALHRCSCGCGFDSVVNLKHHQRNHIKHGERPCKCDTCDKDFLHPKDLRRHIEIHKRDTARRFHCSVPGCKQKGFSRKDNLTRHLRDQHDVADSVMLQPSTPSSDTLFEELK